MSETGHAKNNENLQQLIIYAQNWGPDYNPGHMALKLPALEALRDTCEAGLDTAVSTLADAKVAINDRENLFKDFQKLVTRIVNYYAASGTDENRIADVRALKRKIDGKRKEALKDDPLTPENEMLNGHSVAQTSYGQMIEHFDAMIELLAGDANYAPNEADLKIPALMTYSTSLKAAGTDVMTKVAIASNARGERDQQMYAPQTGLVDIALAVKKYVRAAFGSDSPQFRQISGLKFSRPSGR